MTTNVGIFDARLRLVVAAILFVLALALTDVLPSGATFVGALVALLLLATGLTRVCPLYSLLHLNTSSGHTAAHRS